MRSNWLKILVTIGALILITVHVLRPQLSVDAITLGLVIVAVLPWLSALLESAEFPGGLKVKFREVAAEQKRQKSEIDTLKFIVSHFVSDYELEHLRKLANNESFIFQKGPSETFFEAELRHLLALGFIDKHPNKDISTLFYEQGEVKTHFYITDAGREYLKLRQSLQSA